MRGTWLCVHACVHACVRLHVRCLDAECCLPIVWASVHLLCDLTFRCCLQGVKKISCHLTLLGFCLSQTKRDRLTRDDEENTGSWFSQGPPIPRRLNLGSLHATRL